MNGMITLANYLKRTWAGVFFFTLFIWFAFHLWQGERGYYSYKKFMSEHTGKEQEYANLKQQRKQLENKVKHLRPSSIDPDLLDERVRVMLKQMGEDEYLLPVQY
tara:strand:+ start:173 stop:487 length:315 start_codon:yes stop_codon:yes gene_type:complete